MSHPSVALLVDGDNVSPALAGQILRKTKDLGSLRIRRVYGTAHTIVAWAGCESFKPVVAGGAKNGTDILLSIEAMMFALRDGIETFAVVSSDRDFSHIAHALRELGHHVEGLGEEQAPTEFRRACSHFTQLDLPKARTPNENLSDIDAKIRSSLEAAGQHGILVTHLNAQMRNEHGIKISEQPEKKWKPYLGNRPELYTIFGDGKEDRVRIATEN